MKRDGTGDLPLDSRVFSNQDEARLCDGSGICCYNHSILITYQDARRIIQAFPGIVPEELLVFFVRHEEYKDADLLTEYPEIYIEGGPCYMALRFITVPGEQSKRVCRFLDRGSGKCTIHEIKPMVCRTYPFIIQDGKITRLEKTRCMRPYHPVDQQAIRDLQHTLLEAYEEFDAFKEKVTAWNAMRKDKTFLEFFKAFFKFI